MMRESSGDSYRLRTFADLDNLSFIRGRVREYLESRNIESKIINHLLLVIDEFLSNLIEHGMPSSPSSSDSSEYNNGEKDVSIEIEFLKGRIKITLEDKGNYFDPTKQPLADPLVFLEEGRDGGMGIFNIKNLVDIEYQKGEGTWKNKNILLYPKL